MRLLSFLLLFLLFPLTVYTQPSLDGLPSTRCIYNSYPGNAMVTSIKKTDVSKAQKKHAGYEGYEILFKLNLKTDKMPSRLKKMIEKPYLFLLNNGWYPGDAYIKKYAIKAGTKYPGTLKVRQSGNCPRPIYFDEPTLKGDDYFEGYLSQPEISDPNLIITVDKPVIYLYPEKKQNVKVELLNNKNLLTTYPAYPEDGWHVEAHPDGKLIDLKSKKSFYTLFWEAKSYQKYQFTEGALVSKKDTAAYLEKSLTKLGLNWRERNEFIIYWLPKLEQNELNIIRFVFDEYTDRYPLKITPKPDTLIRVFMVFQKAGAFAGKLRKQRFPAIQSNGFTVVEWGGSEIK